MKFEWDEEKRLRLMRTRNLDILDAARMFADPGSMLVWRDDRKGIDERRFNPIGKVDDEWYEIAFAERGDAVRLITVWRLSEKSKNKAEARHSRRIKRNEGEG